MIGGQDIVITTRAGVQRLDVVLRVVRRRWSGLIVEDALTGERFKDYNAVPFANLREVLVYRDRQIADEWQQRGACDSLRGTMIHAIAADNELTLVVDCDPPREIRDLTEAIEHAVRQDILNIVVSRGEAA